MTSLRRIMAGVKGYKTKVTPTIEIIFIFNVFHYLVVIIRNDDDYKVVEMLTIKMILIFGVTIVLYLIKILSGYRNSCERNV